MSPGHQVREGSNGFVAGTPVLMGDFTARRIEQVRVGDTVLAFDGGGPLVRRRVVRVRRRPDRPLVSVDHTLLCGRHALLTAHGVWRRAGELVRDERLMKADGSVHIVEHVVLHPARETVFDIDAEEMHTYVAGRHGFRARY